jgi:hypothetical protein
VTKKKMVKIELANTRFVRSELKDHASEFIHYAKYAGYMLTGFNKHLTMAKIFPLKPEIAERNHRLVVETTLLNAKVLFQITQIYPSFKNWSIKSLTPDAEINATARKVTKIEVASKGKPVGKKKKVAEAGSSNKNAKKSVKKSAKKPVKKAAKKTAQKKTTKKKR